VEINKTIFISVYTNLVNKWQTAVTLYMLR